MPSQLLYGALQQGELAARRTGRVQAGTQGQVAVGARYQSHILHDALQKQNTVPTNQIFSQTYWTVMEWSGEAYISQSCQVQLTLEFEVAETQAKWQYENRSNV